jgi:hypothetical protein
LSAPRARTRCSMKIERIGGLRSLSLDVCLPVEDECFAAGYSTLGAE